MANLKFWRCYNPKCTEDPAGRLGYDFFAIAPICPKCKANKLQVQHVETIVPLVVTHYLAEDPKGKIPGKGVMLRVACNAEMTKIPAPPNGQASRDLTAVTCPGCKNEVSFLKGIVENDIHLDYQIDIDTRKKAYKLSAADSGKSDESIEEAKAVLDAMEAAGEFSK